MAELLEYKITWRHRFNQFKHDARIKTRAAVNWVVNNPDKAIGVITLTGMVVGAGCKGYKKVSKFVESRAADRRMYCGTVNRYITLKHQLTDREIKELAELMSNGLTRYDALSKMDLIK